MLNRAILIIALVSASANAEPDAQHLFLEGAALQDAGQAEAACRKFEQSLAKDPRQMGVLMNLGLCNERQGKLATALRMYQEAFDRAREADKRTTRDAARDEIAKLIAKVPIVRIERAVAPLPGEKLVIDDVVVPLDQRELPLDPGRHVVVQTAPGRLPWQHTFEVGVADRVALGLAELPVPTSKVVTHAVSKRLVVGKIATLTGAGLAIVGAGLVLYARHDYSSLFPAHCGVYPEVAGATACDATGHTRADRDRTLNEAGLVFGVAGFAMAATGAVLWATAPREHTQTMIVPAGSPTLVGVLVRGAF